MKRLTVILVSSLLLLGLMPQNALAQQTKTWRSYNTDWDESRNWRPSELPGPNDHVVIGEVSPHVDLSGTEKALLREVGSLELTNTSTLFGDAGLRVNGAFTWNGQNAILPGSGDITAKGGITFIISLTMLTGESSLTGRVLNLEGSSTIESTFEQPFQMDKGMVDGNEKDAVINIQEGASLDIIPKIEIGKGGRGIINNFGTVVLSGGHPSFYASFINAESGTVEGSGTFDASVKKIENKGTFSPGFSGSQKIGVLSYKRLPVDLLPRVRVVIP